MPLPVGQAASKNEGCTSHRLPSCIRYEKCRWKWILYVMSCQQMLMLPVICPWRVWEFVFFLWNKVDWTCLCLFRATASATATNRQYAARLIFQEILTVGGARGTVGGARGTVGGAVKGTTSDTQFTQPHVCVVPAVRPSAVGLHDDQRRQGIREYSLNVVQK